MEDENLVVAILRQEAEVWKQLAQHNGMQGPIFKEWLFEHGELCGQRVKVKGLRLMAKKQCYMNSMQTIIRREVDPTEWFYTEGVVASPDLPILIEHAWLTNRKGEVLDRTLRSNGHSYYGIPFKPDYAINAAMEHGYYGLFSGGYMYNRKIVGQKVRGRAWRRKK